MSTIPLVDLRAQYASIKSEIDAAISSVVDSTAFVGGPAVREFEVAFAAFCEAPHAVSCANGTDAIHLALRALGVGPGDEVVTVANTFIATAEAITMAGATPIFVDVRSDGLMDPAHLESALSAKTRAVIPVHLYGQAADIDTIAAVVRPGRIAIIEDAAQAHGARLRGRRVGSLGDVATFSFYPGKNLGAYGDGGAATFGDGALAQRFAMLRDHGRTDKYLHASPATTVASTRCKRRSCRSSSLAWTLGTHREDVSLAGTTSGLADSAISSCHSLLPTPNRCGTCMSCIIRTANACGRRSLPPGSVAGSIIRCRCICSPPIARWATSKDASPSPSGSPRRACPCRCTRKLTQDRVDRVAEVVRKAL